MFKHGGSPLSGAGSSVPSPLRSDLGNLADRHGAGVPARGPTYVLWNASRPRSMFLAMHLLAVRLATLLECK